LCWAKANLCFLTSATRKYAGWRPKTLRLVRAGDFMRSFTILLAAYNRLDLLRNSVESALAVDWQDFEVLVIDDGSEAETRAWLNQTASQQARLRVIHQPNAGVAAARALGVRSADKHYITILDSDDRIEADALQRLDQAFELDPNIDLIYGNIRHVYPDGRSKLRTFKSFASNRRMIWGTFLYPRVPFKHSGITYPRALALELGNYDANLPIKIDIDFMLKFMHNERKLHHLAGAPLVSFHVHDQMMSRKRGRGIPVWFELINRYGPKNPLGRGLAKLVRGSSESLKSLYERVRG
jgi:glycosyltransferase involved in cell wall biosynthesis